MRFEVVAISMPHSGSAQQRLLPPDGRPWRMRHSQVVPTSRVENKWGNGVGATSYTHEIVTVWELAIPDPEDLQ